MSTYYFGYGANTNLDGMARRCPTAKAIAPALLKGWRLVFRGVADVIESPGHEVFGALWRIEDIDEVALDVFEGYPNLYVKAMVPAKVKGAKVNIMLYRMRDRNWMERPSRIYENVLRQGYEEWGLPQAQIDEAIRRAASSERRRDDREAKQLRLLPLRLHSSRAFPEGW